MHGYNNPIKYFDPTGHFTEEAIWDYIYGSCNGSASCASDMMSQWKSDQEWWEMLLAAEAGDILVGGSSLDHGVFYTFAGQGRDVLEGIFWSDPYGEPVSDDYRNYYAGGGDRSGLTLNDFCCSGFEDRRWDGFIRWNDGMPALHVRSDAYFQQEITSDGVRYWLSRAWNAVGFFGGLAIPGGSVQKGFGLLGVVATPSIDAFWLDMNGMQYGDVQVFIGDHRLIFHGLNNSYRLRNASWAFGGRTRGIRYKYWWE